MGTSCCTWWGPGGGAWGGDGGLRPATGKAEAGGEAPGPGLEEEETRWLRAELESGQDMWLPPSYLPHPFPLSFGPHELKVCVPTVCQALS